MRAGVRWPGRFDTSCAMTAAHDTSGTADASLLACGARFDFRALAGVREVGEADWAALFPAEPWTRAYYGACETAPPAGMTLAAVGVFDAGRPVLLAPTFSVDYRLDLSLPASMRRLGDWLDRTMPKLVRVPVLSLGSPLSEHCHIGIAAGLDAAARARAIDTLLTGLAGLGRQRGAHILSVKDLPDARAGDLDPALARAGFAKVATLPVGVLDLPKGTLEDYLAGLNGRLRSELRRKQRQAAAVRVEFIDRIGRHGDLIAALYEETRRQEHADYGDFDEIAPGYFAAVMQAMPDEAGMVLYWLGDELIGFNLFISERDRIIGKFIGMRYPVAREHNLYFINWLTMVRYAMERGKSALVVGQTSYAVKARLGAVLERSWIYYRHRNRLFNKALATLGPRFPFDLMDHDLKLLGVDAPYRDRADSPAPHH